MSIEPARAFNADLDQACCTGDFKAGNSAFKTNAMQCNPLPKRPVRWQLPVNLNHRHQHYGALDCSSNSRNCISSSSDQTYALNPKT